MNPSEIVKFLKSLRLFRYLSDDQLLSIAEKFEHQELITGKILYRQGDVADAFFVITHGNIHLRRTRGKKQVRIGPMTSGDFFGEEGLLTNHSRSATVVAGSDSKLIKLDALDFNWLNNSFPQIKKELITIVKGYKLARRKDFSWLDEEEIIHRIALKNIALLWLRLVAPMIFLILSGFLTASSYLNSRPSLIALGILGLTLSIMYAVWKWIDWGNDFYIITDQRVVWLEKIIGIYDSRQEAPLSAVLSVNVSTSPLQRLIASGNVIIRTYTGSIVLKNVDKAKQFAAVIDEYWKRARQHSDEIATAAIEQAIRQRLGFIEEEADDQPESLPVPSTPQPPGKSDFGLKIVTNFFKMRFEEGNKITYRKHWFIGIQKTWKPMMSILVLLIVASWSIYAGDLQFLTQSSGVVVWGALLFAAIMWWLYHYIDWRNDIYVLTPTNILDIERKPLGREEKISAPLESVLSLEHSREGAIGLMLNFGNVKINVGATSLIFYDVFSPADVQHDIYDRLNALKAKINREKDEKDRTRMAEWFDIYHQQAEDARNHQIETDFYSDSE